MEINVEEAQLEQAAATSRTRPKRRPRWPLGLAVILASLIVFNLTVWVPVATVLGRDDRNAVTSVHVYRSCPGRRRRLSRHALHRAARPAQTDPCEPLCRP